MEPDREGGDASVAALFEGDFCGQERVSDEDCGAAPARLLADWSDIRSKAVDGRGVCEVIDTGVFLFEAQLPESDYVGFFNFCRLDGLFPCSFREGSSDIGGYDFEVGTLSFVPKNPRSCSLRSSARRCTGLSGACPPSWRTLSAPTPPP